jgi:outer membrane protein assembly factor BamE (lipoprotein component of BamABCDE complex)
MKTKICKKLNFLKWSHVLYVVLIFVLYGCGGVLYPGESGSERIKDESVISKIEPEKTNMNEVRSLLGEPYRVTKSSNGDTIWDYSYSKYWMNSYTAKVAAITFNKDKIVKSVSSGAQESTITRNRKVENN